MVLSPKSSVLSWTHLNRPQQVPQYDARFCGGSGMVVRSSLNLLTVGYCSFGQKRNRSMLKLRHGPCRCISLSKLDPRMALSGACLWQQRSLCRLSNVTIGAIILLGSDYVERRAGPRWWSCLPYGCTCSCTYCAYQEVFLRFWSRLGET